MAMRSDTYTVYHPGYYETVVRKHKSNLPPEMRKQKKKSRKKKYRIHVVWNLAQSDEMHVPLAYYTHLESAYKKINTLRAHHLVGRRNAPKSTKRARIPTFFIEFLYTEKKYVRAFELSPDTKMNVVDELLNRGMITDNVCPRDWIIMPSTTLPSKKHIGGKKKTKKPF